MQTCIGCGCGFGLVPPFSYKEPLHRGKTTICPSCDKWEEKRGYLHPSDSTWGINLIVWHKNEFKRVSTGGHNETQRIMAAMKNMTAEQRREYLLGKASKE